MLVLRYSGLRLGDAACLERSTLRSRRLLLRQEKTSTDVYVPIPHGWRTFSTGCRGSASGTSSGPARAIEGRRGRWPTNGWRGRSIWRASRMATRTASVTHSLASSYRRGSRSRTYRCCWGAAASRSPSASTPPTSAAVRKPSRGMSSAPSPAIRSRASERVGPRQVHLAESAANVLILGGIKWSHESDSNRRPAVYETAALPTELSWLRLTGQ